MSVLVVVAALGEMACPVVVGNVSLVSDVLLSREAKHIISLMAINFNYSAPS